MDMIKGAVSAVVPQSVKSYALSTAEYLAPVMTESQFRERGMLTPEEFVTAGDMLVLKCPTWQWSAGDPAKVRPHLPADKQFLVTRSVPCLRRAKALAGSPTGAPIADDMTDEDGWTSTPAAPLAEAQSAQAKAAGLASAGASQAASASVYDHTNLTSSSAAGTADDDIPNMEEFEQDDLVDEDDDAALAVGTMSLDDPPADNIVRTRTYDISITYDKYYRCPRVWMYGYTEARQPLTAEQVLEDVSAEHANKTCTMEPHPNLEHGVFASIHPCRHAEVMKKLCEQLESGGSQCRTDQYLFLFLKFISTVIPTIEYDYTMSFQGF
mmetsp:Transcript_1782/g.4551  ORF Transcript_1782/g.4551 Transcript_1782/m.4551 type:complete len:325 (-) Transcript_1782:125-1099(-)